MVIESLQSYDPRNCTIVERGASFDVPNAFTPTRQDTAPDLSWQIKVDQFGNYIYLNAPDEVVESLVCSLLDKAKYRVLSWDSTKFLSEDGTVYAWYIQLSSGLSSTAIGNFISKFASASGRAADLMAKVKEVPDSSD